MTSELDTLTRRELDVRATEAGLDPDDYGTKADLIAALAELDTALPDDDEPAALLAADGRVQILGLGPTDRAALYDVDARHPGGSIFIRGGDTALVIMTSGVRSAIRARRVAVTE